MVERIERQHQILLTLLEMDRPMKAEEFKVSNQNEVLIFLERKKLITRDWNDSKKKDFKWNYLTFEQKEKAEKLLNFKHESQKSEY